MKVLSVDSVTKSFRHDMIHARTEVLHGVSFEAGAGEILGFLGPNGAGKTTTIKIVLDLIRPDSGSVTIFGMPAGEMAAKAKIGYMPENPYFYPHLSFDEFLRFCGNMSGMSGGGLSTRIAEVTGLIGLEGHGRSRLKNFSKGMLQRAGLAQAILHDPDLLILDEPFSGLDPLGRKAVRDILLDLKRRNKTIFFSSHILPDMEALCDRTCIIRDGVVTRSLGLDDIFRMGQSSVEITARDVRGDALEAIAGYTESIEANGEETFLVVREQKLVRTVIMHLYNTGAEVLGVSKRHPSLEEVFIDELSREKEPPAPFVAEGRGTSAATGERVKQ